MYQPTRTLLDDMLEAEAAAREAERRARSPSKADKAKFRSSLGWKRTRYLVLALNAEKNNGTVRCEICGRSAEDGARVERLITATRFHLNWDRRLDVSNLRALCSACNGSQSNRPINGL